MNADAAHAGDRSPARQPSALANWLAPAEGSRLRLVLAWALLLAWLAFLLVLYFLTVSERQPAAAPLRGYGLHSAHAMMPLA